MGKCSAFAVVLSVVALACRHGAEPTPGQLAPAVSAFDRTSLDTTCAPCRDFFQYANGSWVRRTEIPAAFPSWGSFNELYVRNLDVLHGILDAAARDTAAAPGTNRRKLGVFYGSCMDSAGTEAAGIRPLQAELDRIAQIGSVRDLAAAVARVHRVGGAVLFTFSVDQDRKHSSEMIAQAGQGGLGLPDRDYYTKSDTAAERLKRAYTSHVARGFELLGAEPAAARQAADQVMAIETALATASMTRIERRDPNATYHKLRLAELEALMPGFAWGDYLRGMGAPPIADLNVLQPAFFTAANTLLTAQPLDAWRSYLRWHLIDRAAPWLAAAFANEDFAFQQLLTGVKEQQPRWRRCVQVSDRFLGEALGQAYVAQTFSPEAKRRALEMVHNLEAVMQDRLHRLAWMSDATRQQALGKLATYGKKIGYPDRWRDYGALKVEPGAFIANVRRAAEFETDHRLAQIGRPVDRGEWGMTPPTVNAYNRGVMNEIVFPAGILQPPFFDPKADDALNYGGMGAVIGHELTHGFDDEGRKYDAQGNLRDWWTKEDADRFIAQANLVVDQFSSYVAVDSLHVNGRLTLGENLADLNGLRIAYAAFARALAARPGPPLLDGFTPEQRFFLGWAQIWRGRTRDAYARLLVTVGPHSPPQWRVNGPLSNMTEFARAFGCKVSDAMVRSDSLRPRIW
jgi:putative endopeptidase